MRKFAKEFAGALSIHEENYASVAAQANRSLRLQGIDYMAALSDYNPAGSNQPPGCGAGWFHQGPPVFGSDMAGRIGGADRLSRSSLIEEAEDCGLQPAIEFAHRSPFRQELIVALATIQAIVSAWNDRSPKFVK